MNNFILFNLAEKKWAIQRFIFTFCNSELTEGQRTQSTGIFRA